MNKQKVGIQRLVLIEELNVTNIENWQNVVQKALRKFGKVDILLNVAGVITPGFVEDFALKDIDYYININVRGDFDKEDFEETSGEW